MNFWIGVFNWTLSIYLVKNYFVFMTERSRWSNKWLLNLKNWTCHAHCCSSSRLKPCFQVFPKDPQVQLNFFAGRVYQYCLTEVILFYLTTISPNHKFIFASFDHKNIFFNAQTSPLKQVLLIHPLSSVQYIF